MNNVDYLNKLLPELQHEQSPAASNKYRMVNSRQMVELLENQGFIVRSAQYARVNTKDEQVKMYGKHHIMLINQDIKVHDSVAQISLINSYDAKTSFQGIGGVFRWACSNGMVFGIVEGTTQSTRTRHLSFEEEEKMNQIIKELTETVTTRGKVVSDMSRVNLTPEEAGEFALDLAEVRFKTLYPEFHRNYIADEESLLKINRKEDAYSDLWTIYNRCQEKLINGGFHAENTATRKGLRKMRALTNGDAKVKVNQNLWSYTEQEALPLYSN